MIKKSIFKDGANKNLTHPMKRRGISLIVLVITIIVIVILGTAAIVTFVKNNPIENAKNATKKWNKKTLEEKANMLETELLLEFQEAGLGGMVLPSYAKEVYMDALKEGKAEEEAKQIAMDSFIGDPYEWEYIETLGHGSIVMNSEAIKYSPLYEEVKRVLKILVNVDDIKILSEVTVDESVVPKDLSDSIYAYKELIIDYYKGNVTDEEFEDRFETMEPLYSLALKDPNGKYYSETQDGTLKIPYYIYLDYEKTKIGKLDDYNINYSSYEFEGPSGMYTVILDEIYTVLKSGRFPGTKKEIILPNKLKVIKKSAFTISAIEKLVIPSSVETIDEGAFGLRIINSLKELVIKKTEGSIPGEPWGLDPTKTTIKWEP